MSLALHLINIINSIMQYVGKYRSKYKNKYTQINRKTVSDSVLTQIFICGSFILLYF